MDEEINANFSEYIVYVDESGDHGLVNIDQNYPIFVLCFCVFKKENYSKNIITKLSDIKFKYFGHDSIAIHSHDIRKKENMFSFLNNRKIESEFINDINNFIVNSNFNIISCVIDKKKLKEKYSDPRNPYFLSIKFCLEMLYKFIDSNNLKTHIIFEARGKKEDDELELEFRRRIDSGTKSMPKNSPYEIIIADKKTISAGLEIADLVAHPIGRKILKKDQINRAFDTFKDKIIQDVLGNFEEVGLKVFP